MAISASWLLKWILITIYLQLLLWSFYIPVPLIALLVTFLVARRFRQHRMAPLLGASGGYCMLFALFLTGLRNDTLADRAFLAGLSSVSFVPLAYLVGRLAARGGRSQSATPSAGTTP